MNFLHVLSCYWTRHPSLGVHVVVIVYFNRAQVKSELNARTQPSVLRISWPYEVNSKTDHGKHVLYLMEVKVSARPPLRYLNYM